MELFCEKNIPKNFARFTGKHLFLSPFIKQLVASLKKKPRHMCFPKFCEILNYFILENAYLQDTCQRLLLDLVYNISCFWFITFPFDYAIVKFKFPLAFSAFQYTREIFRKTSISYSLIRTCTCAYQGVKNIIFSEILPTY